MLRVGVRVRVGRRTMSELCGLFDGLILECPRRVILSANDGVNCVRFVFILDHHIVVCHTNNRSAGLNGPRSCGQALRLGAFKSNVLLVVALTLHENPCSAEKGHCVLI